MSASTISKDISVLHQSPWQWLLAAHQVSTLAAEPRPRWLKVEDGSVWLTRRESGIDRADDVWLRAGDSFELPAGSTWVLEAWAPARLSMLQQPGLVSRGAEASSLAPLSSLSSAWTGWVSKLTWLRASLLYAA